MFANKAITSHTLCCSTVTVSFLCELDVYFTGYNLLYINWLYISCGQSTSPPFVHLW